MTRIVRILLGLTCAAYSAVAAHAQALPSVRIADSDPSLSARLGNGGQLYLRLAYRSDRKVRFRVEGVSGSAAVDARNGGAPLHPAGSGDALAWIAYPAGTAIDGLRISILDKDWHEITSVRIPAQLRWEAGVLRDNRQRPDWVARLTEAQTHAEPQPSPSETSGGVDWMGDILVFGTPGYLLLQILLAWVWAGRWRAVALVPAFVVGPALAAGSNLWPIVVLLVTPLGLIYLTAVIAARGLVAIVRA
jgi:hypothetical protein